MAPLFFTHVSSFSKRSFFAVLSGLLQLLIFPNFSWSFLVWVALIPLLICGFQERHGNRAFLLGVMSGIVFFGYSCYWIFGVLNNYGNIHWIGASFLFILLIVYLAIYQGIFVYLYSRYSLKDPKLCLMLSPIIWVSTEYLRAHMFTGFPWCLIGYGFIDFVNFVQLARYTGVYGLSFLAVLSSSLIFGLFVFSSKRYLCWLLLLTCSVFGISKVITVDINEKDKNKSYARIVQTNIDVEQQWNNKTKIDILNDLTKLSLNKKKDQSQNQVIEVIVWPETPAPFYYNHDSSFRSKITQLAQKSGATVVFGFVDFRSPSKETKNTQPASLRPYNSVGTVSSTGKLISQYDKIHLVPFGEYIPLKDVFFFIDKISTEAGNFQAGQKVILSPLESGRTLGTVICYEVVVPDLVRQFVSKGAELLVSVTNDSWFGDTPAPYQHLLMARMRAVENNRYLLRAANSGISAVVNPNGQILTETKLYAKTILESPFWWKTTLTFYSEWGDIFAFVCLMITALSFLLYYKK